VQLLQVLAVLGGAMGVATAAAMRHAAKLELIQNKTQLYLANNYQLYKSGLKKQHSLLV
jgi:uncharacterized membrane protein YgdD (TMEM256/DUF423 family)